MRYQSRTQEYKIAIQPYFGTQSLETILFKAITRSTLTPGRSELIICLSRPINDDPIHFVYTRYAATDDPRHPTGSFIAYRQLLQDLGEGPCGTPGGRLDVGRESDDCRRRGQHVGSAGGNGMGTGEPGSASPNKSSFETTASYSRVFGKPTGLKRVRWTNVCSLGIGEHG